MKRRGFTLVEMLTVIVIISILAGLIAGGAISARSAARRAVIVTDIQQLAISLENYKNEFGEYPPDFSFCNDPDPAVRQAARNEITRHVRLRWPRMKQPAPSGSSTTADLVFDLIATSCKCTPAPNTALAIWLGGPLDSDGTPTGFSEDPSNPFRIGNPRKSYHQFESKRMFTGMYLAPATKSPYCYFRTHSVNGNEEYGMLSGSGSVIVPSSCDNATLANKAGLAVPYLEDTDTPSNPTVKRNWLNPGKYQIISTGLDGKFSSTDDVSGTPVPPQLWRMVPSFIQDPAWGTSGIWFSEGDYDNLTNCGSGRLEDTK